MVRNVWWISFFLLPACTAPSYLADREPEALILRKRVYGGVAAMTGTELASPSFSLYANGRVIVYGSVEGKRRLVTARIDRRQFFSLYDRAAQLDFVPATEKNASLPITELLFEGVWHVYTGLGFVPDNPALDPIDRFAKDLDRLEVRSTKVYVADSVVVFVKRVSTGDINAWPTWPMKELNLESVYRTEISFYDANVPENSIILRGVQARRIQKLLPQTGLYEKFSSGRRIYAVGYKPLLP